MAGERAIRAAFAPIHSVTLNSNKIGISLYRAKDPAIDPIQQCINSITAIYPYRPLSNDFTERENKSLLEIIIEFFITVV